MAKYFLHSLPAVFALLICTTSARAQVTDLGLSLSGLLASNPQVSAEFALGQRFGLELSTGTTFGTSKVSFDDGTNASEYIWRRRGVLVGLQAKYYFSPDEIIDGFYIAPYLRYRHVNFKPDKNNTTSANAGLENNRLAVGVALGYKVILAERFPIEVALGAGAAPLSNNTFVDAFSGELGFFDKLDNLDLYARISAGYRLRR